MAKVQTFPLEFTEKPTLDVHVMAERIRLMPVEPGGQARVEVEGRRDDVAPIEVHREGDTVHVAGRRRGAASGAGAQGCPAA